MLPNVLPSPSPDAHVPVLAREVGALLDVHPGELIVDCTFGAGGHSRVLAARPRRPRPLVAIDRDPTTQPYVDALRATVGTGVQVRPMHGPFAPCLRRLVDEGAQAGAVLMDLGMSSMQVDAPARGFSYMHDAPLDMRMDPSDETTAATLVNEWDERDLAHIFHRYGEERFARQIARAIVRERKRTPFDSTLQLVDDDQARDPDALALRAGASRQARVPGAADRRQRRARPARGRARERARALRRPAGASPSSLPLARGPHGQAALREVGRGLHLPARPAGLRLRPHARVPPRHQQGRAPGRRGGRRQPALRLGAAARRAAGGDGVSAVARTALGQSARAPGAARARRVSVTSALLILACAAVLIGIVTLQVAVLRLNSERGDLQVAPRQRRERQQRAARAARRPAGTGSAGGPGDQARPRAARRSSSCTTGSLGH